jgi:Flp pilus assembly protein TadB
MPLRSAKNPSRLPWWRRPIDEKKFGIFGTRAGALLLIAVVAVLVENPWAILVLLGVAAVGLLFALAIRHSNRQEPPSLGL